MLFGVRRVGVESDVALRLLEARPYPFDCSLSSHISGSLCTSAPVVTLHDLSIRSLPNWCFGLGGGRRFLRAGGGVVFDTGDYSIDHFKLIASRFREAGNTRSNFVGQGRIRRRPNNGRALLACPTLAELGFGKRALPTHHAVVVLAQESRPFFARQRHVWTRADDGLLRVSRATAQELGDGQRLLPANGTVGVLTTEPCRLLGRHLRTGFRWPDNRPARIAAYVARCDACLLRRTLAVARDHFAGGERCGFALYRWLGAARDLGVRHRLLVEHLPCRDFGLARRVLLRSRCGVPQAGGVGRFLSLDARRTLVGDADASRAHDAGGLKAGAD